MVAKEAGVGRGTVSRVINGEPDVSAATIENVKAAIARLNYVPNRAARSLASNRTMAIAMIVSERAERFLDDLHLTAVVRGIAARLEDSDYVLNLIMASRSPSDKITRYLQGGNVDGALVVSQHTSDSHLTRLHEFLPVMYGGQPVESTGSPSFYVDVDNTDGARLGTQHLIGLGRRRIGTIAGPEDMPAAITRLEGWRRAMEGAGLNTDAVVHADFTVAGATNATRELLAAHPDLDAIFVASDPMATGTVSVLLERGLTVPGDVAIVGFDDSAAAVAGPVRLTTVRQPSEEMGRTMADSMLRLLAGDSSVPQVQIMPTELVVRDSA